MRRGYGNPQDIFRFVECRSAEGPRVLALQKLTIYCEGVLSGETGGVGKGEVNDIFVGVGKGTDTVATIVTTAVE